MDEKERLNALEVALNNEMREREFYLNNAKRTKIMPREQKISLAEPCSSRLQMRNWSTTKG
jgi:hypothetical protein